MCLFKTCITGICSYVTDTLTLIYQELYQPVLKLALNVVSLAYFTLESL